VAAVLAQSGLKAAVHQVLESGPAEGLKNSDTGRLLGIYMGHVEHEGQIPRTLLALMESEGVVEQIKETKAWRLRTYPSTQD
jgi:hypothetical protein